jgi:hypothetical protein
MNDERAIVALLTAVLSFLGGYLGSTFKRQAEIDTDYVNIGKLAAN